MQCLAMQVPPPPLVVPHPLLFPGGGGGASLGQPKIFRCGSLCCCVGDCVVGHYHLHPLHSWQDILLTFAEMEVDSTTMFPPGTSVMFICSTGEPVLAQVVGHSEHGDAYAEFFRFMLQFLCLQMCVYSGGVVPQGGVGDRHLVTIPQGVVGNRFPWGGERQGGGIKDCLQKWYSISGPIPQRPSRKRKLPWGRVLMLGRAILATHGIPVTDDSSLTVRVCLSDEPGMSSVLLFHILR